MYKAKLQRQYAKTIDRLKKRSAQSAKSGLKIYKVGVDNWKLRKDSGKDAEPGFFPFLY